MKKTIKALCLSLLMGYCLEVFIFNHNAFISFNNESINYETKYGSGIDWNSDSYIFVSDLSDALIYYSNFTQLPNNFFLNYELLSSNTSQFDLYISEYYEDDTMVMYRHHVNYNVPSTMYLTFDKPIKELIINIKDMDQCIINDLSVQFNQDIPMAFSLQRMIQTSIGIFMIYVLGMLINEKRKEVKYGKC